MNYRKYIDETIALHKLDAAKHLRIYAQDHMKILLLLELILQEFDKEALHDFLESEFL